MLRLGQPFNFGVVATLQALERDGKAGSHFDVWKTLTTARHSGVVAAGVPLMCQRAGVAAGRTSSGEAPPDVFGLTRWGACDVCAWFMTRRKL